MGSNEEIKSNPDVTHSQEKDTAPRHRIERRPSVIKMSRKLSPPREPSPKQEDDTHQEEPMKEEHVDVERVSPQSFANRSYPLPERVVSGPLVVPMNLSGVPQNSVSTKLYNYHQLPYFNPYSRALPLEIFPYHPYTLMTSPCCGRVNVASIRPRSVIIRPDEEFSTTTRSPPPLIKAEPDDVVRDRYEEESS